MYKQSPLCSGATGHVSPSQTGARQSLCLPGSSTSLSLSMPVPVTGGHRVMVHRSDLEISTYPLYQFTLTRAIVVSLFPEKDTVRLYLVDHGMQTSISTNSVR